MHVHRVIGEHHLALGRAVEDPGDEQRMGVPVHALDVAAGPPRGSARRKQPLPGQGHRIALLVGRGRVGVDLVEEEVTGRHRPETHGRVGTREHLPRASQVLTIKGEGGTRIRVPLMSATSCTGPRAVGQLRVPEAFRASRCMPEPLAAKRSLKCASMAVPGPAFSMKSSMHPSHATLSIPGSSPASFGGGPRSVTTSCSACLPQRSSNQSRSSGSGPSAARASAPCRRLGVRSSLVTVTRLVHQPQCDVLVARNRRRSQGLRGFRRP
jgi:hypothetical protein